MSMGLNPLAALLQTQQRDMSTAADKARASLDMMMQEPVPVQYTPMAPPDPMGSMLRQMFANYGTAVSGNPLYQQQAFESIETQRREAARQQEQKQLLDTAALQQRRSELIAQKIADVQEKQRAASELGLTSIKTQLEEEELKLNQQQLNFQKKAQEDNLAFQRAKMGQDWGISERNAEVERERIAAQERANSQTGDPRLDRITGLVRQWQLMTAQLPDLMKAYNVKNTKDLFAKAPEVRQGFSLMRTAMLRPMEGEKPQDWLITRGQTLMALGHTKAQVDAELIDLFKQFFPDEPLIIPKAPNKPERPGFKKRGGLVGAFEAAASDTLGSAAEYPRIPRF